MPHRSFAARHLLALAALGSATVLSASVSAQETVQEFSDTIHVIQRRPVLQKQRVDLTPRFGVNVNDAIYRNFRVGANLNYHFSERFYAGAIFDWYDFGEVLGGPTQSFRDVDTEARASTDAAYLNWAGGAELGFAPLVGKFALFNRGLFFYDVSVSAGVLFANSASIARPSGQSGLAGTAALSTRVFLNDWMALNLEVRDTIYNAQLRGLPDGALTHSVSVGAGVSLYVPTAFEYSDSEEPAQR
ncbi:outer membrane beta-barrel domain-containing protein [Lujinxingia vulgaris]|uniref:Outer membrane beta-barrel domain-containing protein n=1 Tax=Lujinxingia vulgaris TaxID=2600176 RepID=A0A5C6XBL3_9DELT|nr:outer membrane beta-barrel domain-containing protein [Lujinxingia vulgaris]TXD37820.1 outer membrane beta-barrel domain-containing protein [Lujinxingia vulgaris]